MSPKKVDYQKGTRPPQAHEGAEVSDLRQYDQDVIAILCADLHFQHKPPKARASEADWYKAMLRPIEEIKVLLRGIPNSRLIIAGDITTKWFNPPILVNWLLEHFPEAWAVPGNHDLPYHSYEEMKRSTYWTLVMAGRIHNLDIERPTILGDLRVHAFPCGFPVHRNKAPGSTFAVELAVAHTYVWTSKHSFKGAPKEQRLLNYKKKLKGYDAVLFGDNHKGFLIRKWKQSIFNAGSLMRRHSDEKDYKPSVGLLHIDGKITRHYLDCSKDKIKVVNEENEDLDLSEFIEEVLSLGGGELDFVKSVQKAIRKIKPSKLTKRLILESLEKEND